MNINKGFMNEDVKMEKLERVAQELLDAWTSKLSPDRLQKKMTDIIRNNGFIFLGRGQNRLAFMIEGDAFCYKVPYREIGFRDNYIERNISSMVSGYEEVYRDIGDNFALVTDFAIGDGELYNFMICQEYLPNVEGSSSEIGMTVEENAILGIVENGPMYVDVCKRINKYFHILDAHARKAANNWGVKNNQLAIRDYGYFIPRVEDLANAVETLNINGMSVDVEYLYNALPEILANPNLTMNEKIDKLMDSSVETWCPCDSTGKRVGTDDDLVEAEAIGNQLLQYYIDNILD